MYLCIFYIIYLISLQVLTNLIIKMTQLLNGRYEIFDPTNVKSGSQGVVFFVKDKKDNNEM